MRANHNDDWVRLLVELRDREIVVEDGLTESELRDTESRFEFCFPPDLRALLATGLPASEGFPDWRDGDEQVLLADLAWPLEGMCFDIERNGFWLGEWGARPDDLQEAFRIAAKAVTAAPRLVPVFGHRYIPADPSRAGNPVFSVYQTDIILYGIDLLAYFRAEFSTVAAWHTAPLDARPIRFWSDLMG